MSMEKVSLTFSSSTHMYPDVSTGDWCHCSYSQLQLHRGAHQHSERRVESLYLSTCSTCIQKGKKLGVGTKKTERGLRSELLSRTPTNFWDKNGGNLHRWWKPRWRLTDCYWWLIVEMVNSSGIKSTSTAISLSTQCYMTSTHVE